MSFYTLKQKKNIVLGVTCALGIFIAYALRDVFTAFLGAIIFYTLFKPLFIYFTEKRGIGRGISAIFVLIISFIIIIIPFSALCLMIIEKIIQFRDHPEEIDSLIQAIDRFAFIQLKQEHIVETILDNAQRWAMGAFSSAINGILGFFLRLAVMYFIFYFMLTRHEKFESTFLKYMPFREENSMIFAAELKNLTYSNVLGQGIISIIQGGLVGVGFLIFGLKDALFWTIISIFLSFLPIVGAGLVFVPAGLIALSHNHPIAGYGIIIWGFIIVTNVDNFIRMFIAKRFANTHPLITILGVVLGVPIFGVFGLVFGPLLLSYFILLVKIYEIRYIKKRPIAAEDFKMRNERNHLSG